MKKILLFTTFIFSLLIMTACGGIKVSEDVVIEGITISHENYSDDKKFDKVEYYLNRNNSYEVNIYITNEKEYEITSVDLSGVEYTKEDFSEKSTIDKIVIELNTKNDTGIYTFKLGTVKFTDGKKYFHAKDENSKEIKLFVKSRFTPIALVNEEHAFSDEHELLITITDREMLINYEEDHLNLFVYLEEELVETVKLGLDQNAVRLTNLKIDETYTYEIIAKYDRNDGEGLITETLNDGNFKTVKPFIIEVLESEETFVEFKTTNLSDSVTLDKIEVYKNDKLVKEIDSDSTRIEGLVKATNYELRYYYSYTFKGDKIEGVQKAKVETFGVLTTVVRRNQEVRHPSGKLVQIPPYREQDEEIRAIWVSTVSNIDINTMIPGEIDKYKNTIREMFDNIKDANFNTVYFQIRPMNDAFYPSNLAPWSRYIAGREGRDPGFDVLGFALEEAHSRELELHGWLNPYRVSNSPDYEETLDEKNFAAINPDLVITDGTGSILDPGQPKVQQYIRDVISEIIENYPAINGIHFDDYFYLSSFGESSSAPDYSTYQKYKVGNQSFADYRRAQVTKIIKDIFNDVEAFNLANNSNVRFGISPSGIWANKSSATPDGSDTRGMQHYSALYADTKLWIEKGYIHYIVPQIYWDFNLAIAPYGHLVEWWSDVVKDTDVDLIIGMGPYRYRSGSTPWTYVQALPEQLRYNQNRSEVSGVSFFTYRDIVSQSPAPLVEAIDFIKDNYWTKSAKLPWETNIYK